MSIVRISSGITEAINVLISSVNFGHQGVRRESLLAPAPRVWVWVWVCVAGGRVDEGVIVGVWRWC